MGGPLHPQPQAVGDERLKSAAALTNSLRRIKSEAELALMQHAKNVTLEAQRRARDLLRPGILVSEVIRFIDETHRKFDSDGGNTFCLVSFAEDTTLPHGGEGERALRQMAFR